MENSFQINFILVGRLSFSTKRKSLQVWWQRSLKVENATIFLWLYLSMSIWPFSISSIFIVLLNNIKFVYNPNLCAFFLIGDPWSVIVLESSTKYFIWLIKRGGVCRLKKDCKTYVQKEICTTMCIARSFFLYNMNLYLLFSLSGISNPIFLSFSTICIFLHNITFIYIDIWYIVLLSLV